MKAINEYLFSKKSDLDKINNFRLYKFQLADIIESGGKYYIYYPGKSVEFYKNINLPRPDGSGDTKGVFLYEDWVPHAFHIIDVSELYRYKIDSLWRTDQKFNDTNIPTNMYGPKTQIEIEKLLSHPKMKYKNIK